MHFGGERLEGEHASITCGSQLPHLSDIVDHVGGIDQNAVSSIGEQAREGGVLAFLQLFSGNALTQFSLFALGIMPYITSSIIMQILTVVIPKLQEWQQQGAVGQRKITQWTRYLTIGIAVLQSTGLVFLFHNGGGGLVSNTSGSIDLVPTFTPAIRTGLLSRIEFADGKTALNWKPCENGRFFVNPR